ncbi:C80 family cysteine peptidase, partial [Bathymodiolus thermophilus thioautotrophic gill symbiont]
TNLTQEGAQSLADKAKILQQTYGNNNTKIKRMALVGCDTDGVDQALTRNFANAVYNDMPALKQTEITGRTGQMQVNDNGTKTMTTGGTKTIYSWDNDGGGIAQKTETVKSYSDSLENPLGKFDDQIKEIDALLKITPMSESTKKILTDTRNAFSDINYIYQTAPDSLQHIMGLMEKHKLELKAYLDEHKDTQAKESLEAFRDSLNAQCADLQFEIETRQSEEFSKISKGKSENRTLELIDFHKRLLDKTSVYLDFYSAWQEHEILYEIKKTLDATLNKVEDIANKASSLDTDEKIKALAEADKYINYLYEYSEYFAEADQTRIKEFKTRTLPLLELSTWNKVKIANTYYVPLVDNSFRVIVQLSDDLTLNTASLASKHFGNSTLVQMDKYGNYRVVHGPELGSIPDGKKVKFEILGHGNDVEKTMGKRTAADMAKNILDLKEHIPKTVDVTAVSLKGCCAGADYGKNVLIELHKENFKPIVSSKLGLVEIHPFGRTFTSRVYHSEDNRTAWKYDENDKIVAVPYADEKHHIVISVDEEDNPKVIKTHNNKDWKEFKGNLRVKVEAGENLSSTLDTLEEFQAQLKIQGAKMSQIDIETGEQDWLGGRPKNTLQTYGSRVRIMTQFIGSNITLHIDSGLHSGSTVFSYKDASNSEIVIHSPEYLVGYSDVQPSNVISFTYDETNIPRLAVPIKFNPNVALQIAIPDEFYTKEMVLSQLQQAKKEVAETSSVFKAMVITGPRYLMPEQESKDLLDYLSQKLGVRIERSHKDTDSSKLRLLLSKNPGDSEAQVHGHLAHQDTPLHNWDALSQDQINKLDTESQKPKLSLANHDHQILIQTEADDNVKDNTSRLASKHPTQTTIVQMQKDGAYKVVYGTKLENITGRVKMVVVGYDREENGVQTLGGRNESELSDNILTLKRDLTPPANAKIGRTSLVACNLESNNLTDNPDSQYGKQVIQRLHQGGINGDLSVRSSYVGIQPDGTKVTSDTGVDNWKHKDSEAKTVYSYDKNGKVESKVYDNNGVLVKYNGQHLDGTRYKSNIIVQNSDNATVVEAANALFNKRPNTSVIVKFDQNGNLVTLKGEAYTPTGGTRVNFVDHGANLNQEGAQSLADKARILQQTYGNSDTKIKRMALVGC